MQPTPQLWTRPADLPNMEPRPTPTAPALPQAHRPAAPRVDARGCLVSGASAVALDLYEQAVAAAGAWRLGAESLAAAATDESPHFVMAHVLQAYSLACSRDPRRVRSAQRVLEPVSAMPMRGVERLHLAAIGAIVADRYLLAKRHLERILTLQPRDLLALQALHTLDYLTGDVGRMADHVRRVLPAWHRRDPGFHALLAMLAFGLEEGGDFDRAEELALAALALEPRDARAHHTMAHVFDGRGDADAGARWLLDHADAWQPDTTVTRHAWWHLALFRLARGEPAGALALYDVQVRQVGSDGVSELIDATSLLWRLRLAGHDVGTRWRELAGAWGAHLDDAFCSFTDVHAMLAFVGADDSERARRLQALLDRRRTLATRYGETTHHVAVPACRALAAYGRGDDTLAITLLASLPAFAFRLGGSRAQRDVLHLTLEYAIERTAGGLRRGAHTTLGA
jgi:hypothetical protein